MDRGSAGQAQAARGSTVRPGWAHARAGGWGNMQVHILKISFLGFKKIQKTQNPGNFISFNR